MRKGIEGPYGAVAKIDAVKQVVTLKCLGTRERLLREKERDSAAPSRDGTDTGRLNNSSLTGESILVAITKL